MNSENNILRNILFPKEHICPKADLYYRSAQGRLSEDCLHIRGTAVFDTYFNAFPIGKYREYCTFSGLFLTLKVCGVFVLRIFGMNRNEETLILEKNIRAAGVTEDVTDISSAGDFVQIYFSLESDDGILYGGNFSCTSESCHAVNTAVVICTFKREKFLLRNHREICEYLESQDILHERNIHFYIVDNGKTLDKNAIENEYTTLIPNRNTGGSGGFTRGYYEALHSGRNYTHILFMDDDIVLDCEMLVRVYGILRTAKDTGLAVGGTMIKLSDFITQHEAGALWDGKRHISLGMGADLTKRENVLSVSYYPEADYNAWWFYCFPSEWQSKYGYPLQFFIKEDDIEYSLRCADQIAVLSGLAVWHDDFESKYDGFQEYYIKRNELILTSVNHQKPYAFFQVEKLVKCVMRQVVYQRYFLADIVIRAYDDYLKGWEHFRNTDTEKLNRELMDSCQALLTDEQLKQYGIYFDKEKYDDALNEQKQLAKQIPTFNGYFIPKCFYKKDKDGFAIVPLAGCKFINFYRHKKILHYDVSRNRGFVTEIKQSAFWKYCFVLLGKSIKFLVKYPSVRRGYKEHLNELADYQKEDGVQCLKD